MTEKSLAVFILNHPLIGDGDDPFSQGFDAAIKYLKSIAQEFAIADAHFYIIQNGIKVEIVVLQKDNGTFNPQLRYPDGESVTLCRECNSIEGAKLLAVMELLGV